jgi:hypothetical protein
MERALFRRDRSDRTQATATAGRSDHARPAARRTSTPTTTAHAARASTRRPPVPARASSAPAAAPWRAVTACSCRSWPSAAWRARPAAPALPWRGRTRPRCARPRRGASGGPRARRRMRHWEDLAPVGEGLVGRHHRALVLVAAADEFEQQIRMPVRVREAPHLVDQQDVGSGVVAQPSSRCPGRPSRPAAARR